MIKLFISTLIFSAICSGVFAQSPNDFRGFSWGNPLEQVQANEKSKFVLKEKDDALEYADQLAGSDCSIIYTFNDNNKLISGVYVFTKNYSNPQLYIQDYNKFKGLLIKKYGKPKQEKENWGGNFANPDKERYGQSVADGNLTLNADWDTERSLIKIDLISSESRPSLRIHYTTRTLNELENKEQLEQALSKL